MGILQKFKKNVQPKFEPNPKLGILFLREEVDIDTIIGADPPNLITVTDQKLYDRMLAGVMDRMAKNPEQIVKG